MGPKTLAKLVGRGITTVGDLAGLGEGEAARLLGDANGRHLWRLAHGIDHRRVEPDQQPKSISHEETFARDHHDRATLQVEVVRMADAVAARLRDHGFAGRTVAIKVRFHDFRTITRAVTLPAPIDTGPDVARAAKALLEPVDPSTGVRLLGVGVSGLTRDAPRQLTLDDASASGWTDATRAVDEIRRRFGDGAIVPATLRGPDGIRVKRRGDQQWGPGDGR